MTRAAALFIGHGSPRDAMKRTVWSESWEALGEAMPRPRAILCVSAHWESKGVLITRAERPRIIHDFYRFPQEFYELDYPARGDPALAYRIEALLENYRARADLDSWGLDHGAWTVLRWMYPDADIPVVQISLDVRRTPTEHCAIGRCLASLREEGVMLLGTGNIVHNLRVPRPRGDEVFPWAKQFDDAVAERIEAGDHHALIDYAALPGAADAVPEPEHYLPLLYVIGAADPLETPRIFNRDVASSVSMTSVGFGLPS
jgi:4,5-DOPA dioxygenase extradiol